MKEEWQAADRVDGFDQAEAVAAPVFDGTKAGKHCRVPPTLRMGLYFLESN